MSKENEQCPLKSIQNAIAFSSRDWTLNHRDAWIYCIIMCENQEDYIKDIARKHNWAKDTVERLIHLNKKFQCMVKKEQ